MSKGAKINAFLLGLGFSAEVSYQEAQRLEKKLNAGKSPTSAPKRVPSEGLCVEPTIKERVMSYATSRRGHEWSLEGCVAYVGAKAGAVSAQITHLLKEGLISRTGRAKYVKNYNKN